MIKSELPSNAQREEWDAIIVGTGMGGSTLGFALARAGWRVLFVEKGRNHLGDTNALRGAYPESFFPAPEYPQPKHRSILERAGRWWEEIDDRTRTGDGERYIPFLGCGAGGSSALYGMALERFHPSDFAQWPVSYEEFLPYYHAAEELYRVRGTPDPLRESTADARLLPPPPLHPANRVLMDFLVSRGLHPYRMWVGCEYERGPDRCQGFLDATGAKNDAASICLGPALERYGAKILDECEVRHLEATQDRVTSIHCERNGQALVLRGRVVVLGAGGLATPCILLRSASTIWPDGVANSSGLVGRNLMRHFTDLYLIRASGDVRVGSLKELAFNDWYEIDGVKYGTVQSFGYLPPADQIFAEVESELRRRHPALAPLFRLAGPLVRWFLARKLANSLLFFSILEDTPQIQNFVRPGGPGEAPMVFEYKIAAVDAQRIAAFRVRMQRLFKSLGITVLKQAENNARLATACGTCRFGVDPHTSVLDPFNRAHDLENLYIVDLSFLPTSGGSNLCLTLAANALRVADHVLGRQPVIQNRMESNT